MWIIDEYCTVTVDDPRKSNTPRPDKPGTVQNEGRTIVSLPSESGHPAIKEAKSPDLFLTTQKEDNFAKDEAEGLTDDDKNNKDVSSKSGNNKALDNRGIEAGRSYSEPPEENKSEYESGFHRFLPIYSVGWVIYKQRKSFQSIYRFKDTLVFPRSSAFDPKPILSLDFSSNARIRTSISNDFDDEEETNGHESPTNEDQDNEEIEGSNISTGKARKKGTINVRDRPLQESSDTSVTSSANDEKDMYSGSSSRYPAENRYTQRFAEMLEEYGRPGYIDEDIYYEYSPSPSPPLNIGKSVLDYGDIISSESAVLDYEYSPTPTSSPDFYEKYKDILPCKRPDLERVRYIEFYYDSPWTKRKDFYARLSPLTIDSTHILVALNGLEPETARQTLSNGRKSMIPIFNWKLLGKSHGTNKDDTPEQTVTKSAYDDDKEKDERIVFSPQKEINEEDLSSDQPPIRHAQHVPRIRSSGINDGKSKELRQKLASSTRIQALPNKPKISTETKRYQTPESTLTNKAKKDVGAKRNQINGESKNKPKEVSGNKEYHPTLQLPNKPKVVNDQIPKEVVNLKRRNEISKLKIVDKTEKNKTFSSGLPNKPGTATGLKRDQTPAKEMPIKPAMITGARKNQTQAPVIPKKPVIINGAKRNNAPIKALPNKPAIRIPAIRNQTPNRLASKASLSKLPLLPSKSIIKGSTGKEGDNGKYRIQGMRDQQVNNLPGKNLQPLPGNDGNCTPKSRELVPLLEKSPSPIGVEQTGDPKMVKGIQEVKTYCDSISSSTFEEHLQREPTRNDHMTIPKGPGHTEDVPLGITGREESKNGTSPISNPTGFSQGVSNPSSTPVNGMDSTLSTGSRVPPKMIGNPGSLAMRASKDASLNVRKEWEESQIKRAEQSQLEHLLRSISPSHTKSEFSIYKPLPSISVSSAAGKAEKEVNGESPRPTSSMSFISPNGLSSKEVLPPIGLWSNESCCAEPRVVDGDADGMDTFHQTISSAGEIIDRLDGDAEFKLPASESLRNNKNLNSRDGHVSASKSVISSVSSVSLDSYMDTTTDDTEYDDVNFCYFRIIPSLCNGQTVPPLDLSYIEREEEMEAKKREQRDPESYYLFSSSEESLFSPEEYKFHIKFVPKGRLILNPDLKDIDATAIIYKPITESEQKKRTIIGYHSDSKDWYKKMGGNGKDKSCGNTSTAAPMYRSPFRYVGTRPIDSGPASPWCSCPEDVQTTSYGTSDGMEEEWPSCTGYTEGNTSTSGALSRMLDDDDELFPTHSGFLSHDTYTLTPDEWNFDADYSLRSPVQAQNGPDEPMEKMDLRLDLGDLLSPSDSDRNNSSASTGSYYYSEEEEEEEDKRPNFLKKIKKIIPCL